MTIENRVTSSSLQQQLAGEVLNLAIHRGIKVSFEVVGVAESYIQSLLDGICICIYADGFDLSYGQKAIRFEADDIDSIAHAKQVLVLEISKALESLVV
jgi:hypothetical protein